MTYKKVGCDACEAGEVFVYYKNETNHTIRCDFYYCIYCHPNNSSSAVAQTGEEEIDVGEYDRLSQHGWNMADV